MRGKKIDNDFLTSFITACTQENKCLPNEIVDEAKYQIKIIEEKIKETEILKLRRAKLLDIISVFSSHKKETKKEDIEKIQYFNIENSHICKYICDTVKINSIKIDSIKSNVFSEEDILFCIKRLLEKKVIYRVDDCLLKGINFDNYYETIIGK